MSSRTKILALPTYERGTKSLLADSLRRAFFLLSECASRGAFLLYRALSYKVKTTSGKFLN